MLYGIKLSSVNRRIEKIKTEIYLFEYLLSAEFDASFQIFNFLPSLGIIGCAEFR